MASAVGKNFTRNSTVRKFEIHLDALIVVIVVFALAAAFLIYQRYQYSNLLQENVDLVWENSNLEANLVLMTSQLEKCKSSIASVEQSEAKGVPANSPD